MDRASGCFTVEAAMCYSASEFAVTVRERLGGDSLCKDLGWQRGWNKIGMWVTVVSDRGLRQWLGGFGRARESSTA